MRRFWMASLVAWSSMCGTSRAGLSASDEIFANAALSELHSLAVASAKFAQAAKDYDNLGCRYANDSMEEAARHALEDMHNMSFAPIDAIQFVAELLRLEHLAPPNGCYFESSAYLLPLTAGQAIMALRWDYAIGDGNWYAIEANGDVSSKNPLLYSQSLKDLNYSWVSTRPKNMVFVFERDWKSEMASIRVDDPTIEHSGKNVEIVEVDYRKNSADDTAEIFFYRSKESALAVIKKEASRQASEYDWKQRLASLPFIVANRDVGFKLIYEICKPGGADLEKVATCNTDDSHDWSDDPRIPYRWFSEIKTCEDELYKISRDHPSDVKLGGDDFFTADCVPAPRAFGRTLKGYEMAVAITSPAPLSGQPSYARVRNIGSQTAILFDTFAACRAGIEAAYSRIEKYLDVDDDGRFLSDKTKSITATVDCVRVY